MQSLAFLPRKRCRWRRVPIRGRTLRFPNPVALRPLSRRTPQWARAAPVCRTIARAAAMVVAPVSTRPVASSEWRHLCSCSVCGCHGDRYSGGSRPSCCCCECERLIGGSVSTRLLLQIGRSSAIGGGGVAVGLVLLAIPRAVNILVRERCWCRRFLWSCSLNSRQFHQCCAFIRSIVH